MAIEVNKKWASLSEQRVSGKDGEVWNMAVVADKAKDLEPFDIPMEHLCIDSTIGGMKIREFVAHMRNIMEADLSHPIILDQDGSIFDGRHRAARALFDKMDSIKAVRFNEDPPATYME